MSDGNAHEAASASLAIRPNRSLSVAGVTVLFVALSALALTVGIGFALAGAWMVLPFAALEVLIVGLLCRWFYRHIDDCELVVVERDRVKVVKRSGTRVSRDEFPRYWVRVISERERDKPGLTRLRLGSHGRFVTLAEGVNGADRETVARELQALLRAPA